MSPLLGFLVSSIVSKANKRVAQILLYSLQFTICNLWASNGSEAEGVVLSKITTKLNSYTCGLITEKSLSLHNNNYNSNTHGNILK